MKSQRSISSCCQIGIRQKYHAVRGHCCRLRTLKQTSIEICCFTPVFLRFINRLKKHISLILLYWSHHCDFWQLNDQTTTTFAALMRCFTILWCSSRQSTVSRIWITSYTLIFIYLFKSHDTDLSIKRLAFRSRVRIAKNLIEFSEFKFVLKYCLMFVRLVQNLQVICSRVKRFYQSDIR